jgi:hypothetical protein
MDPKFYALVEELTALWLKWMANHNISNNREYDLNKRRQAGSECENLQRRRQIIIQDLNTLFNDTI